MLATRDHGRFLSKQPGGLRGSGTAAWRRRLSPANNQETWRGVRPRLRWLAREHLGAFSQPTLRVLGGGCTSLLVTIAHRWRLHLPLGPRPALGVIRVSPRLGFLWQTVLRGLGGLCRLKLRFKGKSYKWHRRRGALMLRFGHAHLVALPATPGVRWRRLGRMKIVLFGSDWWSLLAYAQAVCWWRPVNVYHGRGIRLRRQHVWRKAGKVSAYR